MNGDGVKDIIVGECDGYVNYFERNSDGTLKSAVRLEADGAVIQQFGTPVIIDWNGDNKLDILIGSIHCVFLYTNIGTEQNFLFDTLSQITIQGQNNTLNSCVIQVVDFNKDGRQDLLFSTMLACQIFYSENIGTAANPVLAEPVELLRLDSTSIGNQHYDVFHFGVADFNGDGIYDILDPDANLFLGTKSTGINNYFFNYADTKTIIQPYLQQNTIQIRQTKPSAVSLHIISLKGQIVYTHHYGIMQAGTHRLQMDIPALSNGQYIINCSVGFNTCSYKYIVK